MRTFAWKIAWGVFAILAGVALLMAWGGWAEASAPSLEAVGLIPLFAGIAIGLAAAGGEGQRHRAGKNEGQKLFHHVVFHFGFPPIYLILGGR